jgi:hypothetical protein
MKTNRSIPFVLAGVALLTLVACSPKNEGQTTAADPEIGPAAVPTAGALDRTWNQIKDATYAERAQCSATLGEIDALLDRKMVELQARASSATDATSTGAKAGLEKLKDARAEFRREATELGRATSETWNTARAEVAQAWERVRQAFVTAEPTSSGL